MLRVIHPLLDEKTPLPKGVVHLRSVHCPGRRSLPLQRLSDQDEQLALDLGADAFILKPAEPEALLARVRSVLAAGQADHLTLPQRTEGEDKVLLKTYSEVLVHKLEEKALELEQTNRALEADIAERGRAEQDIQRLNRVYAVLSGINQAIVREKDPQVMMEAVCRIAVEDGKFRMAWIGKLDPEGQELKPTASCGVVEGYTDVVRIDRICRR